SGGVAAAYCWANGTEEQTVAVVETVEPIPTAEVEPEPVAEAVRVELDVKFDFDRAEVKSGSYDDIRNLADFMKEYGQTSTVVDRKSTRLNSSHVKISYAVFCLKKK